MGENNYERFDREQKEYYIHQIKKQLMAEGGLREDGTLYGVSSANYSRKMMFYHEIWKMFRAGAKITINGRTLNTSEFAAAAELLAEGNFLRTIIPGQGAQCTVYKLIKRLH